MHRSELRHRARRLVKHVAEAALYGSGLPALGRARLRSRTLVLAYHNIVPDDHEPLGDRSLHLHRSRFAQQLDELQRHYEIVPLDDAVQGPEPRRRPEVAITFDDAYRGAVHLGVEELAERGLPATIFVCPGRLDGHAFWWDRFGVEPGGRFREGALGECRGREELVAAWARNRGLQPSTLPEHMTSASLAELQMASRVHGITVGAHTWSHPNLARSTTEELRIELDDTLRWLEEHFRAAFVPYLAYPYGLFNSACEEAAASAGYRAGLRIEGGWSAPAAEPSYSLPRMNVSAGLSRRGFGLRLAGFVRR